LLFITGTLKKSFVGHQDYSSHKKRVNQLQAPAKETNNIPHEPEQKGAGMY
jgi:hypothetical protein